MISSFRNSTTFQHSGSVQYNEVLKKFYEKIYSLNRYKIDNYEKSYECYSSLSYLILILDKGQQNTLINWSMTRTLVIIISNIIKSYSDSFKYLFRNEINEGVLDPPSSHSKIMFEKLNQPTRKIMLCSYSIRILYYLIKNSSELRAKFVDLNGFDDLITLMQNDSFVSNWSKHRSLDAALMCLSIMSSERIRWPAKSYGDALIKMNNGDDKTAFIRCKIIYNLFEHNELLSSFEEKILQRTIFVTRILKKTASTQLKAEFNSVFFLYSILPLFQDKSKLIKAILDENTLHVFINQINNLSILFSKFNQFNYVYIELGNLQIPSFDPNDQNRNNVCRVVYYVSVFCQLLVSNLDHYRKQKLSVKKTLTKSICNILTNQQFLNKFSRKYFKTIIELEKCLLYIYTHDAETSNELQLNIFEILFNIATTYETCSKESFLILTQVVNGDKMNRIAEKFAKIVETSTHLDDAYSKIELRNYLCLMYFILKSPKRFDVEKTNLIRTTLRLQNPIIDMMEHALANDNFDLDSRFDYEKNIFDANSTKVGIFFYLINLTSFFLEHVDLNELSSHKIKKYFNVFQTIITHKSFTNQVFYVDLIIKSTNIMVNFLKFDKNKEDLMPSAKNTTDLIRLVFFFVNSDETTSIKIDKNESKKDVIKNMVIENLVFILRNLISYDANIIKLYSKSIETCLSDTKTENRHDYIKQIYHFKEKDNFPVYCKSNFILTYNLMILSEFTRNESNLKNEYLDEAKLIHLLREVILNHNSFSLIEKKYVFQLYLQLYLLNKIPDSFIKNDKEFVNKIIEIRNLNTLTIESKEDENKPKEPKLMSKLSEFMMPSKASNAASIKKYLVDTCEQLLWVTEFSHNNDEFPSKNKIILIYNQANQDVSIKLKNELEMTGFRVFMDSYDEGKFDLDNLAHQMKQAPVVIECLSDDFKNSVYFQMQHKYAILKEKKVISIVSNLTKDSKDLDLTTGKESVIDLIMNKTNLTDFFRNIIEDLNLFKSKFVESVQVDEETGDDEERILKKLSLIGNKCETEMLDDDNESLESSSRGCGDFNVSYSVNDESKMGDMEIPLVEIIDVEENANELEVEKKDQPNEMPREHAIRSAKSSKTSSRSFKLNSALRHVSPSKWTRKQVKMWFELNSISLTIFKCLGSCDGELLFTYHQILTVEPKLFFEELLKKRSIVINDTNETFDADDITLFRLKLKSLFG